MATASTFETGLSVAPDARQSNGTPAEHTTYRIDPATSRVAFTIRKRMLFVIRQIVRGRFADVRGSISLDEREPANSRAEVTIGAASVDTGMAKRDTHLRKADFLDVERYPSLTFRSRRIDPIDRATGHYRVVGDLTVHGVTREVALDTRYEPARAGARARRIKLTLTAPLDRRDFGLAWDRPYLRISHGFTVTLEIEATAA